MDAPVEPTQAASIGRNESRSSRSSRRSTNSSNSRSSSRSSSSSARRAAEKQQQQQQNPPSQKQQQQRSFWYCFAAFQLMLCASLAPLCWLALRLTGARPTPPLGAAPAVIVTATGAGFCLASVGLLCCAQCAPPTPACLARLLWLRIFAAGAGVCAHLAAAGLLLHAAAQLLTAADVDAAACVAVLSALAAANVGQAVSACVHIYNCVTAVKLHWRVGADDDNDDYGDDEDAEVGEAAASKSGRRATAAGEQLVVKDEYL